MAARPRARRAAYHDADVAEDAKLPRRRQEPLPVDDAGKAAAGLLLRPRTRPVV